MHGKGPSVIRPHKCNSERGETEGSGVTRQMHILFGDRTTEWKCLVVKEQCFAVTVNWTLLILENYLTVHNPFWLTICTQFSYATKRKGNLSLISDLFTNSFTCLSRQFKRKTNILKPSHHLFFLSKQPIWTKQAWISEAVTCRTWPTFIIHHLWPAALPCKLAQ